MLQPQPSSNQLDTPAPVWPDVSTLPVYCASCHSQGHVGVSPRSHRTPGIEFFLNEANGKSIFVLDILDQPLHIFTIPCICVMYKNHQVLESGHHHNVHGRHHIYDISTKKPAAQPLSPRQNDKGSFNTQIQHRKSWWLLCNSQVQCKSASHTTFSSSLKRVCALKVPEISKDHFSTTTSAAFSRVEGDWVNFDVSVGWTLSFHVKGSRKMWPSYLLL